MNSELVSSCCGVVRPLKVRSVCQSSQVRCSPRCLHGQYARESVDIDSDLHADLPAQKPKVDHDHASLHASSPQPTLPDTQVFKPQSTAVGLAGESIKAPNLTPGMSWAQWLQDVQGLPPLRDMWATINGQQVHPQQPLPEEPFVLRLRYRLRGGVKSKEAIFKKLQEHLQSKGVQERANQVLDALGLSAVQAAYESLDTWRSLKNAAGTKVRLVLPLELKTAKGPKTPLEKAPPLEDPWVKNGDPWQSGKHSATSTKEHPGFALTLVPGHFLESDGTELPVIQHIVADARGIALLEQEELQSLAQVDVLLSPEVLAAVVIANQKPEVGAWPSESVMFPANYQGGKALFRGFLVNFGKKHATTATAKRCINMHFEDVAIVTVEIRQEYVQDWAQVCKNPLKYVFAAIDGLQPILVANWSRRFFQGRREAPKEAATTWHAFVKIQAANLESLLTASGKGGVFLTPKDSDSGATSGQYRIIWLDTLDLDKATKVHRLHPELLGVIRGKQSLGVRVRAADYSSMRKKLEPSWNPDGLLTDIVVATRWVLAPLPPQADKKAIQQMLQQLPWKATPLKQIAANTWLVGAGPEDVPPVDTFSFAGVPVLITEQKPRKQMVNSEVVVAAPPAFKRAFESHFAQRLPAQHIANNQDAQMQQPPHPPRCLVSELKEDFNNKMQELQAQVQQAINVVNQRVDVVQSQTAATSLETSSTLMQQDQRLGQLEASMQSLSANVVTKVDLTDALRQAMETQAREIRQMLAKRSPEASPAHDAKAPRNA